MATFQPPSHGSPTTCRRAVRAPSKKTSLNSDVPVICSIGRISMPGWRMGTSRYDRPWWRWEPGVGAAERRSTSRTSLRQRGPDLLPGDDPLVAVEPARVVHVGQVGAGVGLGVALAPELLAAQDRRQEAALLLVGAEGEERRADQCSPMSPTRPGPRRGRTPRGRSPAGERAGRARRARPASRGRSSPPRARCRSQAQPLVEGLVLAPGPAAPAQRRRTRRRGCPPARRGPRARKASSSVLMT